jgi:glycine cleavage system H protein
MSDNNSESTSPPLQLQLPADLLFAPEQDMWVRVEADGTVTVGATHVVASHGQFMLFTPRAVGTEVDRDRSLGVMETAKSAVAIHAPLSGRVVAINPGVIDDVALIERDPYGAGWMLRLQPTAFDTERAALLDAESYAAWLAPRLAQKQAAAKPLDDDEFKEDLTVDPYKGY